MTEQFPEDGEFDRRLEVQLEQGSINLAMARAAEAGHWPENPKPTKPSRHTSRGGRSINEGSDSDLDKDWNPTLEPLSDEQKDEQKAIARTGAARCRQALAVSTYDQIQEVSDGNPALMQAITRARAERPKV